LLESITFVLDPGFVRYRNHGTLVLYEAEDVPITNYNSLRPPELEEIAKQYIGRHLAGTGKDMPTVELAVICLERSK
jgi:hypothetical protein